MSACVRMLTLLFVSVVDTRFDAVCCTVSDEIPAYVKTAQTIVEVGAVVMKCTAAASVVD